MLQGHRPTAAYVNLGALKHNYEALRQKVSSDVKLMPIVKANAYGHGDVRVARALEEAGCDYMGVAIVEEGESLRRAGIKSRIVVLNGVFPGQIKDLFDLDLTPVVYDTSSARLISAEAKSAGIEKKIHVKIDTGMGRLGLMQHQIEPFFNVLKTLPMLRLEGVMTHFTESENLKSNHTAIQIAEFTEAVEMIKGMGFDPEFIDMANSAAIVAHPASHMRLARPGIMLYGAYPSPAFRPLINLKPVLELKTHVMLTKSVPAGFSVSYGRKFETTRQSVIATLPIGYADGIPRRLSEKGAVLVRGVKAPIAGVVCMDLMMCDVTDVPDVAAGDEAVIIGSQDGSTITVEEVAASTGTISYEILCGISSRVPRVYA